MWCYRLDVIVWTARSNVMWTKCDDMEWRTGCDAKDWMTVCDED